MPCSWSRCGAFPGAMVVVVIDEIGGSREDASVEPAVVAARRGQCAGHERDRRPGDRRPPERCARAGAVAEERRRVVRPQAAPCVTACRCTTRTTVSSAGSRCFGHSTSRSIRPSGRCSTRSRAGRPGVRALAPSEHDHGLALRLQRSLLPEALPDVPGVLLAGHYRAGSRGAGGRRRLVRRRAPPRRRRALLRRRRHRPRRRRRDADGATSRRLPRSRVRIVVAGGDRPQDAPARDGRGRDDHARLHRPRSVLPDDLVFDSQAIPPPLLLDDAGRVIRLEGAAAPPLGVADIASIQEES